MEIPLETVILRIVEEVLRELKKQGIRVVTAGTASGPPDQAGPKSGTNSRIRIERADMLGYRTPVLTERGVRRLHELTGTVIVPKGTIVSPKATELLRDRQIRLQTE